MLIFHRGHAAPVNVREGCLCTLLCRGFIAFERACLKSRTWSNSSCRSPKTANTHARHAITCKTYMCNNGCLGGFDVNAGLCFDLGSVAVSERRAHSRRCECAAMLDSGQHISLAANRLMMADGKYTVVQHKTLFNLYCCTSYVCVCVRDP